MPWEFERELSLYEENENELLRGDNDKYREHLTFAMKLLKTGERVSPGYKKITGNWVLTSS